MNIGFSEELGQLRDVARRMLADAATIASVRRLIADGGGIDRDLWRSVAELGWLAATIPEEYDGLGLGGLAACVLAEELGRALAPIPFASSVCLATEALILFGSDEQKRRYLPRLASGEIIGTFAAIEGNGRFFEPPSRTRVDAGRLIGHKSMVPDGGIADFAIVSVQGAPDEPSLFVVDIDAGGVSRAKVATIDPAGHCTSMDFAHAAAEPLARALGRAAIERLVDRAAVTMAFEQVGVADAALAMAVAHAKDRYAFARPIGSFQAIKHKLADVYVSLELARSNAYYGAWALQADAAQIGVAAAASRVAACEAAWLATKENIQTHGGMGFTWEGDCHLYYRRAKFLGLALGGAQEWKRRLIGALREHESAVRSPA